MISIGATTLITAGIVYAATISTVTTQTINSGDNIWPGWYQAVNDKLSDTTTIYQCPNTSPCDWGVNSCHGQVTTTPWTTCTKYRFITSCIADQIGIACPAIGKILK